MTGKVKAVNDKSQVPNCKFSVMVSARNMGTFSLRIVIIGSFFSAVWHLVSGTGNLFTVYLAKKG